MAGIPFDPNEPPDGDYARYIEAIGRSQQASIQEVSPSRTDGVPQTRAAARKPAIRSPRSPRTAALPHSDALPATLATLDRFVGRLGSALLFAGVSLFLLATVPGRPLLIDSPLPGIVLAIIGIALKKRFARKPPR